MWLWGRITIWFLRQHIRRELKPMALSLGYSREEAIEASQMKMRAHFDAAWPINE